jgi:N-acetylglucosamine-6-phosphate deacetylase
VIVPGDRPIVITGARIVGGSRGALRIEDGRIVDVDHGPAGAPARAFDASGLLASVGLIDLQINGAAGDDLTSDPESIWRVGGALPPYGVTAFLPTLVSPSFEIVDRACAALLAGPPDGYLGATPLGWHVEGPFLSPARAGAHDPASLRPPDLGAVARWSPDTGVRIVTVAPELPGALEIVRALDDRGVVVSVGHSEATHEQAAAAFDAGARFVTHLFNAMAKPAESEPGAEPVGMPGIAAAALADQRVTVGLIPDGLHVDPALVALVRRAVGASRLAVVTDAIAALGMSPGWYRLANRDVLVDATSARLASGVFAGSLLAMDQGIRNLAAFAGLELDDALLAATAVPARLLGLPARAALAPGGVGDVALFDANLAPVLTIVGGRVAFDATDGTGWA